ncbi:O-antigen ligase family protein [Flavobacterium piscis]|uniref:O-antigen ligase-related domain-containing protein n=1 Tax=Flavobacterium piscis TaxID=1114874 RepID=A0ABU1Y4F4_9FLAO|nr:O-antigen ligase family protein [Flavobacterium piscis]MDR7208938.1 hypothetical protein [Flavobacterium piscis]
MKNNSLSYTTLILIHLAIALAVFAVPFLSKVYALLIPFAGLIYVFGTKNKNNEVLLIAAYMVGVEVFLRMTGGNFNNEYVKVNIIFFMLIGMVYNGFTVNSLIYSFFLILLIPGILLTATSADFSTDIKKVLVFNISGPVCLGIAAIYTFKRNISFSDLQNIVKVMGLPIITTTAYLFLYNPSVQDVVTGTQSNFETSGGFGPNQVSTILGLGMFVFFTQLILFSQSKKMLLLNGGLVLLISYRAIVTFSRGGVMTGVVMIMGLMFLLYCYSNAKVKTKLSLVLMVTAILALAVWSYSSFQTSGLINKRYANEDAVGRVKKDRLGGREAIMNSELNMFITNPVMGVGAGLGKENRKNMGKIEDAATHNEITRMLSEHGLFGLLGLIILFITPLIMYIGNRQHFYFLSFYFFWLLTINHAAMRTAAPAFVYALTLLNVTNIKTNNTKNKESITD